MESIEANVAANVAALRAELRLTVRGLAQRVNDLGRSMDPSGVTKVEKQQRKLGPADLVALAIALNVTPNRLLLTPTADPNTTVHLADGVEPTEEQAWRWARGERPLDYQGDGRELTEFRAANRPDEPPELLDVEAFRHWAEIRDIAVAVQQLATRPGMSVDKVLELVGLSDVFDVSS